MNVTASVLMGAALGLSLGTAAARANYLVNGDLEAANPALLASDNLIHASNLINPSALPGWSVAGYAIDVVPTSYWQNTHGAYSVDLAGTSGLGSISQTVTGLAAGAEYTLTFDFAPNPQSITGEVNSTKILQVTASNTDLAPTQFTGTTGTRTIANMQYTHEVLNFTANASTATLTLAALMPTGLPASFSPSTVWCGPVIDNVSLDAFVSSGPVLPPPSQTGGSTDQPVVPEPTTPLLLGLGVVGLALRKSRLAR